jgi:ATP-binding cassette subfamily F protein 3
MRPRVRNLLGCFLFSGDDVQKKVKVLSGGEKSRLALAKLLLFPCNLLILDEPTNHLDMVSKDVLKNALQHYEGTMIVVSHDRDFLQGLTDKLYWFGNQQVKEHLGDINSFLEKRQLESLQVLESKKNATQKAKEAAPAPVPAQAAKPIDKNLQKEIQKLEKQVSDLETEMKAVEVQLGDIENNTPQQITDMAHKYEAIKAAYDAAYEKWAELAEKV